MTGRPEAVPDPSDDVAGAFRELRQYAIGNLDVDHRDVHPIAGLIDDPVLRQVLMFMAESYDRREIAEIAGDGVDPLDLPASFWETDLARRAIRQEATETATQAIRDGNISQVSYITGLPSYESDISGLHAINRLADWLVHSEQCKLVYLAALMGRGKTDLSLTLMEIVADHYDRLDRAADLDASIPTPEFASNFEVEASDDVEILTISDYDDLIAWAEGGSSDEVRWFIFDEASTELTAQSGSQAQLVAETLGPFVKKMRKLGVNMIVIGHDRGDVHVAIRSLADFVDKTGLKTASFYSGIKKREPTGHLFDVSGIPPTSWDFDTDDQASWSWGSAIADDEPAIEGMSDEEFRAERDLRIARLYELTETTYEDLGTAFDVSRETVRRAVKSTNFERKQAKA